MAQSQQQADLLMTSVPKGVHVTCALSFFPGTWDAVVLPSSVFFSSPQFRVEPEFPNVVVYGPDHLFRKAWMSGVTDYLREPWTPEELFLRLRGPQPSSVRWECLGVQLTLVGQTLTSSGGTAARLSRTEADLLRVLALRQGQVVSRSVLSWAAHCSGGRVIDTLIVRLRRKVRTIAAIQDDPIVSVRGLGYRIS